MTAYQAARRWGVTTYRVAQWIRQGKVKAEKVKFSDKQWRWKIPEDHPCPIVETSGHTSETRQKVELQQIGKRGFVARYAGTLSIGHMAKLMETTNAEVVAIYDDIVAEGGGM